MVSDSNKGKLLLCVSIYVCLCKFKQKFHYMCVNEVFIGRKWLFVCMGSYDLDSCFGMYLWDVYLLKQLCICCGLFAFKYVSFFWLTLAWKLLFTWWLDSQVEWWGRAAHEDFASVTLCLDWMPCFAVFSNS